jgi:aerobic-type carbon monoxide dehydrogenase small subunit (CoxS/CutS family)
VTAIRLRINGAAVADDVPPRLSLADFLRERRNLTGTHLGCEHGVCGACTVLVDGEPARSCLMLAVAWTSARLRPSKASPATGSSPRCVGPFISVTRCNADIAPRRC